MLILVRVTLPREMISILRHRSGPLYSESILVCNYQQNLSSMKKKIQNILYLGVLLLAFSCNKKLDTTPRQSIDEKDALKTASDVAVALIGAYSDFGGG